MTFPLPDMDAEGFDLAAFNRSAIEAGVFVPIDIRAEVGDEPGAALDLIRSAIDADRIVCMWDSAGIMPSFALGRIDGLVVVYGDDERRGNFVTLEAALKHGLVEPGSRRDV